MFLNILKHDYIIEETIPTIEWANAKVKNKFTRENQSNSSTPIEVLEPNYTLNKKNHEIIYYNIMDLFV